MMEILRYKFGLYKDGLLKLSNEHMKYYPYCDTSLRDVVVKFDGEWAVVTAKELKNIFDERPEHDVDEVVESDLIDIKDFFGRPTGKKKIKSGWYCLKEMVPFNLKSNNLMIREL